MDNSSFIKMYDHDYLVRILIVGDVSVGKTSLVEQWVEKEFNPYLYPTIGIDFKITSRTIEDKKIRIQIYDTSGQERFYVVARSYYRNADGVILVYDLNRPDSITNLKRWYDRVREFCNEKVPICIIGNKSDIASDIPSNPFNIPHFQVSALSGNQMEEVLLQFLQQIIPTLDNSSSDSQCVPLESNWSEQITNLKCCG